MISILNKTLYVVVLLVCGVALFPLGVFAQQSQALSVTPTLFEMAAVPTQVWKSSLKVINSNDFPLTVYVTPVNFAPQGERGQGTFLPIEKDKADGSTLAEWITIDGKQITIPPERSMEIPFSVSVPSAAAPGGHFAAFMVGTEEPASADSRLQLRTSQVVSSLFFMRVAGDVEEVGAIRSFAVQDRFIDIPKATFELRFENKGNVHLQPQGTIQIFNMWGSERGSIPVNRGTHFGNVLPNSIRNFIFSWEGEQSMSDIGRYKAVASLGYGLENRKFTTQTIYFWVIPLKAVAIVLTLFVLIILLVRWAIKAYVRHMLVMAGIDPAVRSPQTVVHKEENDIKIMSYKAIAKPVAAGWKDFLAAITKRSVPGFVTGLRDFVAQYRIALLTVLLLVMAGVLVVLFIGSVTKERTYEVTIGDQGQSVNLNSEEIRFRELIVEPNYQPDRSQQDFDLELINTSGAPGTAAKIGAALYQDGYQLHSIKIDDTRLDKRSVVVFDISLQDQAVRLSEKLQGALLSARTVTSTTPTITIYVGSDQKDN